MDFGPGSSPFCISGVYGSMTETMFSARLREINVWRRHQHLKIWRMRDGNPPRPWRPRYDHSESAIV